MTNITYLTSTTPDLRQSMPLNELINRLANISEDWKHPIIAKYADMYHDTLKYYGYNDNQQASIKDFATDIYELVFDLWGSKEHADIIAYKLIRAIYGG